MPKEEDEHNSLSSLEDTNPEDATPPPDWSRHPAGVPVPVPATPDGGAAEGRAHAELAAFRPLLGLSSVAPDRVMACLRERVEDSDDGCIGRDDFRGCLEALSDPMTQEQMDALGIGDEAAQEAVVSRVFALFTGGGADARAE